MKRIGTRLLPAGLPKIARLLLVLLLGAPTPASPTPAPTPPPVLYMVTTLAGGSSGSSGSADGVGGAARFNHPVGIAMDAASGVALVADRMNHAIRRIVLATGAVTTLAGSTGSSGSADGVGGAVRFNDPTGIAMDAASGVVLVADRWNHAIRRVAYKCVNATIFVWPCGVCTRSGVACEACPLGMFRDTAKGATSCTTPAPTPPTPPPTPQPTPVPAPPTPAPTLAPTPTEPAGAIVGTLLGVFAAIVGIVVGCRGRSRKHKARQYAAQVVPQKAPPQQQVAAQQAQQQQMASPAASTAAPPPPRPALRTTAKSCSCRTRAATRAHRSRAASRPTSRSTASTCGWMRRASRVAPTS